MVDELTKHNTGMYSRLPKTASFTHKRELFVYKAYNAMKHKCCNNYFPFDNIKIVKNKGRFLW